MITVGEKLRRHLDAEWRAAVGRGRQLEAAGRILPHRMTRISSSAAARRTRRRRWPSSALPSCGRIGRSTNCSQRRSVPGRLRDSSPARRDGGSGRRARPRRTRGSSSSASSPAGRSPTTRARRRHLLRLRSGESERPVQRAEQAVRGARGRPAARSPATSVRSPTSCASAHCGIVLPEYTAAEIEKAFAMLARSRGAAGDGGQRRARGPRVAQLGEGRRDPVSRILDAAAGAARAAARTSRIESQAPAVGH